MNEMAAHVFGMSNEELGEWMHKAIKDCIEGCKEPDTDCFVKKMYEESFGKMQQKQNINANFYRNRLARKAKELGSAKADTDKTNDPASTAPSASGSRAELATTTLPLISTNDNAQTQTDSGAVSLRGLKSANGVSHCSEAPESNLLQLDNAKKQYGTFRHVRLSDKDGKELREVFGPRLKDAIEFLDNYIESLPSKKAKDKKCGTKYWQEDYEAKNHQLCMLRWVKKALDENDITELNKKAAEARLKKAESAPKSFQQMERDRTSRVLRGESADGKNIVRDEDLTPEELEAKYA